MRTMSTESSIATVQTIDSPPPKMDTTSVTKADVFQKFVKFMSLPDPEKAEMFEIPLNPKTGRYEKIPNIGDFARKYGVHRNTLSNWRNKEEFINAVSFKRKQWGLEKVPNVLASLYTRCIKYGMAYDVETFLAYYDNWDRKQVQKQVREQFTQDDIRLLLSALPKNEQDQFYGHLAELVARSELIRGSTSAQGSDTA